MSDPRDAAVRAVAEMYFGAPGAPLPVDPPVWDGEECVWGGRRWRCPGVEVGVQDLGPATPQETATLAAAALSRMEGTASARAAELRSHIRASWSGAPATDAELDRVALARLAGDFANGGGRR